jgi:hypothetical protein
MRRTRRTWRSIHQHGITDAPGLYFHPELALLKSLELSLGLNRTRRIWPIELPALISKVRQTGQPWADLVVSGSAHTDASLLAPS